MMDNKVLHLLLLTEEFSRLNESEASDEAHKLGLKHAGWRYWKDATGKTVAMTVKGKLVKLKDKEPSNTQGSSSASAISKYAHDDALQQLVDWAMGHSGLDDKYDLIVREMVLDAAVNDMWDNPEDTDLVDVDPTQVAELEKILQMIAGSTHNKPVNKIREKYKADQDAEDQLEADKLAEKFIDPDAPEEVQAFFADPDIQAIFADTDDAQLMQAAALVPLGSGLKNAKDIFYCLGSDTKLNINSIKQIRTVLYNYEHKNDTPPIGTATVQASTDKFSDPDAPPAVQKFFANPEMQELMKNCSQEQLQQVAAYVPLNDGSFALKVAKEIWDTIKMSIPKYADKLGATPNTFQVILTIKKIKNILYDVNGQMWDDASQSYIEKPAETPPNVPAVPLAPQNNFEVSKAFFFATEGKGKISKNKEALLWKYLEKLDKAQTTMDVYNVGTALKKHKLVDNDGWKKILKYHKSTTTVAKYAPGMKKGELPVASPIDSLPDAPADYTDIQLQPFDAYTPAQKDMGAKVLEEFSIAYGIDLGKAINPNDTKEVSERIMAALYADGQTALDIMAQLEHNQLVNYSAYTILFDIINKVRNEIKQQANVKNAPSKGTGDYLAAKEFLMQLGHDADTSKDAFDASNALAKAFSAQTWESGLSQLKWAASILNIPPDYNSVDYKYMVDALKDKFNEKYGHGEEPPGTVNDEAESILNSFGYDAADEHGYANDEYKDAVPFLADAINASTWNDALDYIMQAANHLGLSMDPTDYDTSALIKAVKNKFKGDHQISPPEQQNTSSITPEDAQSHWDEVQSNLGLPGKYAGSGLQILKNAYLTAMNQATWEEASQEFSDIVDNGGLGSTDHAIKDLFHNLKAIYLEAHGEDASTLPSAPGFSDYESFGDSLYKGDSNTLKFSKWDKKHKLPVEQAFNSDNYADAIQFIDGMKWNAQIKQKFKDALKKHFAAKDNKSTDPFWSLADKLDFAGHFTTSTLDALETVFNDGLNYAQSWDEAKDNLLQVAFDLGMNGSLPVMKDLVDAFKQAYFAKYSPNQPPSSAIEYGIEDVDDVLQMMGVSVASPSQKNMINALLNDNLTPTDKSEIFKTLVSQLPYDKFTKLMPSIEKFKKAKEQLLSPSNDDEEETNDLEAEFPIAAHHLANAGQSLSNLTQQNMADIETAFEASTLESAKSTLLNSGVGADIYNALFPALKAEFEENENDEYLELGNSLVDAIQSSLSWSPEDKFSIGKASTLLDGNEALAIVNNLTGYKSLSSTKKIQLLHLLKDKVEANKVEAEKFKQATEDTNNASLKTVGDALKAIGAADVSVFNKEITDKIAAALAAPTLDAASVVLGQSLADNFKETLLNYYKSQHSISTTPPAATSGMLPVPGAAPSTIEKEIPLAAQKAATTLMTKLASSGQGVEAAKKWIAKKLTEKEGEQTFSEKGKEKKVKSIAKLKDMILALDKYHGGSHLAGLTPEVKTHLDNISYNLLTNFGLPVESDKLKGVITDALVADDWDTAQDVLQNGLGDDPDYASKIEDIMKAVGEEMGFAPAEPISFAPTIDVDALLDDFKLGNLNPPKVAFLKDMVGKYLANPNEMTIHKMAELEGIDSTAVYKMGQYLKGFVESQANANTPTIPTGPLTVPSAISQLGIKVPVDTLQWLNKYMAQALQALTNDELEYALSSLLGVGNIDHDKIAQLKDMIVANNPQFQKVQTAKLTPTQAHEQNAVKTFFDAFPMKHKTAAEKKKVESLIKAAANAAPYQAMKAVLKKGMDDGIIGIDEFNALKGTQGIMATSYNKIQAELTAAQKAEQMKQQALAQEAQAKKVYAALPEKSKQIIQSSVGKLDKETNGAYSNLAQAHKNLVNKAILDGLAAGDTMGVEQAFSNVAQETGLPATAVNTMKSAMVDAVLGITPYTPTHEPPTNTPIPDRINSIIAKWTDDTGFGKGMLPHPERAALEAIIEKALQVPPDKVNATISALYTSTSLLDSQIEDMRSRIQQERMNPSSAFIEPGLKKFGVSPAPTPAPSFAPYGLTPKGKPKKAPKALDSIGKKMTQMGLETHQYPQLKQKLADIINQYVKEKNAGAYSPESSAHWAANQAMINMGIYNSTRKKLAAFVKANVKKGNLFNFDGDLDMAAKLSAPQAVAKAPPGKHHTSLPAELTNVADPYGLIQNEIIPGETIKVSAEFKVPHATESSYSERSTLIEQSAIWRKKNLPPDMVDHFNQIAGHWQNGSQFYMNAKTRRDMNRTYTKIVDGPPPCYEDIPHELRRGMKMTELDFIEFAKAFKIGKKVYIGSSGFSANHHTAYSFSQPQSDKPVRIILRVLPNKSKKLKAVRLGSLGDEAEIVLGTGQNMTVMQIVKHVYGQGKNKNVGYEMVMRPDNPDGTNEAIYTPEREGKLGLKTYLWDEAGLSKRTQAVLIKYLNSTVHASLWT